MSRLRLATISGNLYAPFLKPSEFYVTPYGTKSTAFEDSGGYLVRTRIELALHFPTAAAKAAQDCSSLASKYTMVFFPETCPK